MLRLFISPIICFLVLFASYRAVIYNEKNLSPQGCEMSWMSPSYVLQSGFDTQWTPLAKRYSLWLYREVGWENEHTLHGYPVLFIPGNAGSSRQVRSIASSAIRQAYTSPHVPSPEFLNGTVASVDVFAAEFNEDLSALHGPTLLSQKAYIDSAIDYILSLYPVNSKPTQVLLIGHSMGGLVALSLIASPSSSKRISAVVTMSSPNSLPPARFDRRVEKLYHQVYHGLYPVTSNYSPPVLAICGGATDSLIPSETCFLPPAPTGYTMDTLYRQTVFTTSVGGVWTGVGHNEMVWCHQVRSKVASTAIRLAAAASASPPSEAEMMNIFDAWSSPPKWPTSTVRMHPVTELTLNHQSHPAVLLPPSGHGPQQQSIVDHLYMLPFSSLSVPHRLSLLIARGALIDSETLVAGDDMRLRVKILLCNSLLEDGKTTCRYMSSPQSTVQRIPIPLPNIPFPQPGEGSKPGDFGLAVEVRDLYAVSTGGEGRKDAWIGLQVNGYVQKGKEGLVAVLEPDEKDPKSSSTGGDNKLVGRRDIVLDDMGAIKPFLSSIYIDFSYSTPALTTEILLPRMLASSLVAYRVESSFSQDCQDTPSLVPPLLQHLSSGPEYHFHAVRANRIFLLHGHAAGPFVPGAASSRLGLHLRLFASPDSCQVQSLRITVDWWSTLGRVALRYWTVVVVWGIGIVAAGFAYALWQWENGRVLPDPKTIYTELILGSIRLPLQASGVVFAFALLPLPRQVFLGTGGGWILDPLLSVAFLWVATGFMAVLILALDGLAFMISTATKASRFSRLMSSPSPTPTGGQRPLSKKRSFAALGVVLLLVATVLPHQVAFVISWLMVLWTSVASSRAQVLITGTDLRTPSLEQSGVADNLEPPVPLSSIREPSPSSARRRNSPEPNTNKSLLSKLSMTSGSGLAHSTLSNDRALIQHILLLQALLLPTQAPVLAVWIRTLVTAGYSAPFDGDHNIFLAIFWLILAEAVVSGVSWKRKLSKPLRAVGPALSSLLAGYTLLFGLRYPFGIFELANILVAWIAVSSLISK